MNSVKTQQGQFNAKLAEKIDLLAKNSGSQEKQKEDEKLPESQ